MGQLAGGIAHDFNNLLGVIMSCAEILQIDLTDPIQRQFATEITAAAQQAGDLTKKLLAFARRGKYQNIRVDLHAVLEALRELLQRTLDPRIAIVFEPGAASPWVRGDPGQLQTLFFNLALNARDAMPDGGRLTLQTRLIVLDETFCRHHTPQAEPGEFVEVEVRDEGCGIPPHVLPHLFEPFFTTKGREEGSGMGLASVFGAVSLHQGTIRITSEVGKGTSVRIFLPRLVEAAAPARAGASPLPGSLRIMVVDDEEMIRTTLGRLLTGLGHRPILFREGREAIDFLRRDPGAVDLVILDLVLPGMPGTQIFQALRQLVPTLPILLATGLSASEDAAGILAAGAVGVLQKPFRREELVRILQRVGTRPEGAS